MGSPAKERECPKCGIDVGEGGVLVTSKRVRLFGRQPFSKQGFTMVRLGTIGDEEIEGTQCKHCYAVLPGQFVEALKLA